MLKKKGPAPTSNRRRGGSDAALAGSSLLIAQERADGPAFPRGAELTEAAQKYRDNHHWVPLRLKGKAPCDAKWQKRTLNNALPRYGDNDNIGIVLGEASGNLVRTRS